jgi:2'-5' RNA ligase
MAESALVVLVPEAEPLVSRMREMHDPLTSRELPAHITLLYPFKDPDTIDETVLRSLTHYFRTFARFRFSLTRTGNFPGVLYLLPEPSEPFLRLTESLGKLYPEHPPYGGVHANLIPHLTVAEMAEPDQLEEITTAFRRDCGGLLPVEASVSEVWLMVEREGCWSQAYRFQLGD